MDRARNLSGGTPAIELPGLRFALGEDIDMLRATDRKSTRLNQSQSNLVCRLLLEKKKKDLNENSNSQRGIPHICGYRRSVLSKHANGTFNARAELPTKPEPTDENDERGAVDDDRD